MHQLYHGAAYYPELWPEEAIRQDIEHMKNADINVVRMGEFAWSTMEPEQDKIDLSFFVGIIIRLKENGIDTIFCTPTPTPPIWVSHGHPERMYVNEAGEVMGHGARQQCCTNHPFFRERSRIIVEAAAKAVGRLPGVVAWQTDNEFKCHVQECQCAECRKQWGEWLEKRYGTIDRLNDAWGTHIWSEYYQSFDQVPPPQPAPYLHNASLSTAYRIFSREKIAEYQREQVEIIRRYSDAPITHNSHRGFALDNELLFADLDFAAFDEYVSCDNWRQMLFGYELWRTLKDNRSFCVMETSAASSANITGANKTHRPGFLAAEAVAAYASGAEGFSYWVWRQQRTGCEITHGSVISSWGEPTVGYAGVQQVEEARKKLEPIMLDSKPMQAQVAITYSDRAKVFAATEPILCPDYLKLVREWYDAVLDAGIYRDMLWEGRPLDGYKLLLTPYVPYISPEFLAKVKAFVESGGIWIAGPNTGCRTAEHTIPTDAALSEIEAWAGVKTAFTYPICDTGAVGKAFGQSAGLGGWAAVFEPKEAQAIGLLEGGNTPGLAFLTERKIGEGRVVLLGALPLGDEGFELLKAMVAHYADDGGVDLGFRRTRGTVVIPRESDAGTVWVIVNMDGEGGCVEMSQAAEDMITGENVPPGQLSLGSYDYRIVRFA